MAEWCMQSSVRSDMRNLSFAHVKGFSHRHFQEIEHDFGGNDKYSKEFMSAAVADLAAEAADQANIKQYLRQHRQPAEYAPCYNSKADGHHGHRRLASQQTRQQRRQAMPKHFHIDDEYRSSLNQGMAELLVA